MSNKIVVNISSFEVRSAVFEANQLTDIHLERVQDRGLVGNIYLGEVQRVLPGMQAAFVEIGTDKAAFLYVGDILDPNQEREVRHEVVENDFSEDTLEIKLSPVEEEIKAPVSGSNKHNHGDIKASKPKKKIEDVLKSGEPVLVQIAKDAISTKGPQVTTNISLPGRFIVFMPLKPHIGVSRRITDEQERERLKNILEDIVPRNYGCVVRTNGEGASAEELQADYDFLKEQWRLLQERVQQSQKRTLVRQELNLVHRMARDVFNETINEFWIDSEETYHEVVELVKQRNAELVKRIHVYTKETPIFEYFDVEQELEKALARKVWLKSGGSLIIDHAEALTAIDVNTGKFVGKKSLDETILKTNLEAIDEIAHQLRIRNIGGMVIIDFIDMEIQEHIDLVVQKLEEALEKDRARCKVVKISELGLVEMTRRRTKESLTQRVSESCWYCEGQGTLKSKRSVAYEIFRYIQQRCSNLSEPIIVIHANPEVVDVILQDETFALQVLQQQISKRIIVKPRGSFHQEQYNIFGSNPTALGEQLNEADSTTE